MASLTYPLDPDAIRLAVLITWDSDEIRVAAAAGLPVPQPMRAFAVIDTGAIPTAIGSNVVQQLHRPWPELTPPSRPPVRYRSSSTGSAYS
jgi:hypothetical protein